LIAVGEEPLQVARCTKIINAGQQDARYMINVKQFARFVVELGDQVAPSDIEEGMRVGSVIDFGDFLCINHAVREVFKNYFYFINAD